MRFFVDHMFSTTDSLSPIYHRDLNSVSSCVEVCIGDRHWLIFISRRDRHGLSPLGPLGVQGELEFSKNVFHI